MTPKTLAHVAKALFGARWKPGLARELGITTRTLRRWSSGSLPVPDGVPVDLCDLLSAKIKELHGLLQQMKKL